MRMVVIVDWSDWSAQDLVQEPASYKREKKAVI